MEGRRRVLEHPVHDGESSPLVRLGDEREPGGIRDDHLLAQHGRRMQQLGRLSAHPQQRLRVEGAQHGRAVDDGRLDRLALPERAVRRHHRHRVAFEERAAGQAHVVVRQRRQIGDPEVLVLEGVLDLVREDQPETVGTHRACRGGRWVLADVELLGGRIVESGHLLVEDVEEHLRGIDGGGREVEGQPASALGGRHLWRQLLLRLLPHRCREELVVQDLHLEVLLAADAANMLDVRGGLADETHERVLARWRRLLRRELRLPWLSLRPGDGLRLRPRLHGRGRRLHRHGHLQGARDRLRLGHRRSQAERGRDELRHFRAQVGLELGGPDPHHADDARRRIRSRLVDAHRDDGRALHLRRAPQHRHGGPGALHRGGRIGAGRGDGLVSVRGQRIRHRGAQVLRQRQGIRRRERSRARLQRKHGNPVLGGGGRG